MVVELQGKPYVWAEEGPACFDCSGFTYYVYGRMGMELPRTAREQAKVGKEIQLKDLEYGDLIFFNTTDRPGQSITHVGLYLGNGWFTHASTRQYEVLYSNLYTSPYYRERLRVCRRYLPDANVKVSRTKPWKIVKEQPLLAQAGPVMRVASVAPPAATEVPVLEKKVKNEKICATPASKENMGAGIFYVQIGSFEGKPNHNLLSQIAREGYSYRLIQFPKGNIQVNKLLIGPYQSKKAVLAVLPQIKQKIQKDAFIAEIR